MAAAAMIAGSGLSMYAAIQKGEQEAEAYQKQSEMKMLQANESLEAAEREAELTERRADEIESAQISSFGRSGVQMSGSPMAVVAKTYVDAQNESEAIRHAGRYRAFTSQYEAFNARTLAVQSKQAGYMSALSTGLSSAGSFMKAKGALT